MTKNFDKLVVISSADVVVVDDDDVTGVQCVVTDITGVTDFVIGVVGGITEVTRNAGVGDIKPALGFSGRRSMTPS